MTSAAALLLLARLALAAGLVVLAATLWLTLRGGAAAPAVPGERELPVIGGLVVGLREATWPAAAATTAPQKVLELDLQTEAGGTPLTLRVDAAIAAERLAAALNRRATVRHDPADGNRLYVLTTEGTEIVSYADIARRLQETRLQAPGAERPGAAWWAAGAALSVVGAGAVAWRRRRLATQPSV